MTNYPNIKDRIRQLMEAVEMNQKDFAIITGITAPTLSSIFNGRTSATLNHVMALHKEFPNVSMEWLLFGEGNMYEDTTTEGEAKPFTNTQDALSAAPSHDDICPAPSDNATNNAAALAAITGDALAMHLEQVKNFNKPVRNISEIRVFYDDGTFEIFAPKE